ncbi:uncharacterized protein LY89DRAFT_778903 [Mollisia scopiformis]|uniref:Clr5 domain-containing protein n=1 Tax=Mollisia scopiformis TaxID=149040 RepID=A0A194XMM5_MOLSC|nr:uncharacterized protein LY89DRAFT_778903 [Mollisia scopiformis]KUJ21344.1 hypothetical protein LY89DRAFT_778903 [Mollisia scopiformis]
MSQPVGQEMANDTSQNEAAEFSRTGIQSTKERNDRLWDSHKDAIRRIYVDQGRPLRQTMQEIESRYQFKKSTRNWKMKLREWGFEKNMTRDMKFMLAKAAKRERDKGKATEFIRDGQIVPDDTVLQLKRRRISEVEEIGSPMISTPSNITYATPAAIPDTIMIVSNSQGPSQPAGCSNQDCVDHDSKSLSAGGDQVSLLESYTNLASTTSWPRFPDQPAESLLLEAQIAAKSLQSLLKQSSRREARLSDELFERYMENVSTFVRCPLFNEKEVNGLYQDAIEYHMFETGWMDYSNILEQALDRLIRNPQLYVFAQHHKDICTRLVTSAKFFCSASEIAKSRYIFAKVLRLKDLPSEAIEQYFESFYESLSLWKSKPGSFELTYDVRRIIKNCNECLQRVGLGENWDDSSITPDSLKPKMKEMFRQIRLIHTELNYRYESAEILDSLQPMGEAAGLNPFSKDPKEWPETFATAMLVFEAWSVFMSRRGESTTTEVLDASYAMDFDEWSAFMTTRPSTSKKKNTISSAASKSLKYGMTYTESTVSGLSLDYTGLFPFYAR